MCVGECARAQRMELVRRTAVSFDAGSFAWKTPNNCHSIVAVVIAAVRTFRSSLFILVLFAAVVTCDLCDVFFTHCFSHINVDFDTLVFIFRCRGNESVI